MRNVAQKWLQCFPERDYRNLGFGKFRKKGQSAFVMKTKSFQLSGQKGFSLVELLVVIAVIAIIAAIAIPNIANITTQARYAKDQRNAQNIASVAAAAKAAGVTNALGTLSEAQTLTNSGGVSAVSGGQTLTFGVSGLSAAEWAGATNHLTGNTNSGGAVLYTPKTNAY